MTKHKSKAIAATVMVATILVSLALGACRGRKMSNMEPKGETVEVVIDNPDGNPQSDSDLNSN